MRTGCLITALSLLACRAENDQATRPLPAPEPPATTRAELTPATATPDRPRERPTREARTEGDAPKPQAEAPAATTTATATPAASAAPPAAPDPSCHQACQASLQTCLAQQPSDPDGGAGLEGLAACKRALDECKARCAP